MDERSMARSFSSLDQTKPNEVDWIKKDMIFLDAWMADE